MTLRNLRSLQFAQLLFVLISDKVSETLVSSSRKTSFSQSDQDLEGLPGWVVAARPGKGLSGCSLIIPTYRRPVETLSLLRNIAQHESGDLPSEVLVIDGSPDRETEVQLSQWLRSIQAPFDLLYARSRPGLTRQKNAGVDLSSGKYLFFLDDDTEPEHGYFRELRGVFEADPEKAIGAVGGAITNEMDLPLSLRWKIRRALRIAPQIEPMRYDSSGMSLPKGLAKPFAGTRPVDIVPGGASCFRREVFETSRFSEFFAGYSNGEDVEMSLRTGRTFRITWCGSARLRHNPAPAGRPPGFTKGRMDVRNRVFIRRRFWPSADLVSTVRFWADTGLVVILDLVRFCCRPRNTSPLRHAAGMVAASCEALFSPVTFDEPAARRQFALAKACRP